MLLYMDSFDNYSGVAVGTRGWVQRGSTTALLDTATGRFGGSAWDMSSRRLYRNLPGNYDTIITGFAFQAPTPTYGDVGVVSVLDGGTYQATVRYHSISGAWEVFRNGTQIGSTVISLLQVGQWYTVAVKFVIHDSAGSVEVKVNGSTIVNITGVDTQATGNAYVNGFQLGDDGDVFTDWYFDDLYILDDVDSGVIGAPNNNFLGDVRVQSRLPNGNGTTSNFLGSDADSTDNYLLVDDTTPDGDTTYVETSTVNNKDTYNYQNLTSATGTVYGVQVLPYIRKTDAGARDIAAVVRLGATEIDGPNQSLTSSYAYLPDIHEANPDGDQWTVADINDAEFGIKVIS